MRVTGRTTGCIFLSDGTKCQGHGLNALRKAYRKVHGLGASGHPTKRHTRFRVKTYEEAEASRKSRIRLAYENTLLGLFRKSGGYFVGRMKEPRIPYSGRDLRKLRKKRGVGRPPMQMARGLFE